MKLSTVHRDCKILKTHITLPLWEWLVWLTRNPCSVRTSKYCNCGQLLMARFKKKEALWTNSPFPLCIRYQPQTGPGQFILYHFHHTLHSCCLKICKNFKASFQSTQNQPWFEFCLHSCSVKFHKQGLWLFTQLGGCWNPSPSSQPYFIATIGTPLCKYIKVKSRKSKACWKAKKEAGGRDGRGESPLVD